MKKIISFLIGLIAVGITIFSQYSNGFDIDAILNEIDNEIILTDNEVSHETTNDVVDYSGEIYTIVNDNVPYFTEEDINREVFEEYSELDKLGRAGVAFSKIDTSLMPTEDRGSIGSVKPSGWQTIKYDIVSGNYLYNRSHLIGFQLTGENANEENLITGTRYFNVEGMLPFENMVADYIKETDNTVLYRVTPVYEGDNLVASGVIIEAQSIEDDGILFNVFIHNIQPGIKIDYATGNSALE